MIAAAASAFTQTLAAAQGKSPPDYQVTPKPTALLPSNQQTGFPHVGKMPGATDDMKAEYRKELKRRRKR